MSRRRTGSVDKVTGGFRVRMTVAGERKPLGIYPTWEEAEGVRRAALEQLAEHGDVRMSRRTHEKCHVYFLLSDVGLIKIGSTTNLETRVLNLQTSSPTPLHLLASFEAERSTEHSLHARFALSRVRGEWFQPTDDLLAFIARLPKRTDVTS